MNYFGDIDISKPMMESVSKLFNSLFEAYDDSGFKVDMDKVEDMAYEVIDQVERITAADWLEQVGNMDRSNHFIYNINVHYNDTPITFKLWIDPVTDDGRRAGGIDQEGKYMEIRLMGRFENMVDLFVKIKQHDTDSLDANKVASSLKWILQSDYTFSVLRHELIHMVQIHLNTMSEYHTDQAWIERTHEHEAFKSNVKNHIVYAIKNNVPLEQALDRVNTSIDVINKRDKSSIPPDFHQYILDYATKLYNKLSEPLTPEQFEAILARTDTDNSMARVLDVFGTDYMENSCAEEAEKAVTARYPLTAENKKLVKELAREHARKFIQNYKANKLT